MVTNDVPVAMGSRQSQPPAGATSEALKALGRLSGIKRRRRRLMGAGAAAVLLATAGVIWTNGPWSGRSRQLADYTVKAERGSLPGVITASGELEAIRRVNVSPKRAGLVESLDVDEGDVVAKGQVLGRMDRGDFDNRINEQAALEREKQADFATKRADYLRHRQLVEDGAISAKDLDGFLGAYISSKAALNAAQERTKKLRVEGSELLIRALFGGVIWCFRAACCD